MMRIQSDLIHQSIVRTPIISLCMAAFVWMILASSAVALSFTAPGGGTINCDLDEASVASKVVYCVKMASITTAEPMLAEVSAAMLPIVTAALTLALVFLGVQMAMQERDPRKPIIIFLLKFGGVLLVADNFGSTFFGGSSFAMTIFEIMEEMQAVVIPVLYSGGEGAMCSADAGSGAAAGVSSGALNPVTSTPWEYLDCILDYIFGFGRDATIATSVFGFIGSTVAGGSMGAMVFMLGASMILVLVFFVFRTIYTVATCYVYAAFLIILAPVFAATLMFTYTEKMFKVWYSNIVICIVLPMMMVSYLGFALPLLDQFVFNPEEDSQSLATVLGQGTEISDTYRNSESLCTITSRSDFEFFKDTTGFGRMIRDTLVPMNTGANNWCGFLNVFAADMGPNQIQKFFEIAMSMLKVLGVLWLVTSGAALTVDMSSRLADGGRQFANIIQTGGAPLESQIKQMTQRLGSGQSMFGGKGGLGALVGMR